MRKRPPLYSLWLNIRNRCRNPRTPNYRYYGARGITVCPKWDSYTAFVADVGIRPGPGWTLDRIDNDKGYEPGNVRWATRETQTRNRPGYNKLTKKLADQIRAEYIPGKVKQVDLAIKYGVTQVSVSQVVRGVIWK